MVTQRNNRSKQGIARQLAKPGDPYVTAKGQIVQPEGVTKPLDESQFKVTAKTFKTKRRLALKNLPAPVGTINGIACVFMYTVLGLTDSDISQALKIDIKDVRDIRRHSAYADCFNVIQEEFINADSENMSARLAAYSHDALTNIVTLANGAKKEDVKLSANRDVMDRSGYTPKDRLARQTDMVKNELRIIVTKGDVAVNVKVGGSMINPGV